MIIDPIDLADSLALLLKAKNANETYVVRKQHRVAVVQAEILLRELFGLHNPYKRKKPLSNEKILKIAANMFHYTEYKHSIDFARAIEKEHGIL